MGDAPELASEASVQGTGLSTANRSIRYKSEERLISRHLPTDMRCQCFLMAGEASLRTPRKALYYGASLWPPPPSQKCNRVEGTASRAVFNKGTIERSALERVPPSAPTPPAMGTTDPGWVKGRWSTITPNKQLPQSDTLARPGTTCNTTPVALGWAVPSGMLITCWDLGPTPTAGTMSLPVDGQVFPKDQSGVRHPVGTLQHCFRTWSWGMIQSPTQQTKGD
jgi:hypothetical protein